MATERINYTNLEFTFEGLLNNAVFKNPSPSNGEKEIISLNRID